MGRPPLPVGTAGKIRFQRLAPRRTRARVLFRDDDGEVREVTRYGPTQAVAERRLKEALRDRAGPQGGGAITADTRLRDAATLWWAEAQDSDELREQTKETYGRAKERIARALGGLLMREVDVPRCDRFLKAVRRNHGPAAARTAKKVLSLMLGMAVRHGALDTNPVRETAKITAGQRRGRPRALTRDEETALLAKVAADDQARHVDLPDLIEFLDGTGVRIGEALAARASVVDLEAGVVEVNATVVRLKGRGCFVQLRAKSEAGWRVIAVPPHIAELCRRRMATAWPRIRPVKVIDETGAEAEDRDMRLLFPALSGGARGPSNAARDLKAVLDRVDGYGWVTAHTFRRTVATRLDEAGLSARAIADHLGHAKPSMTQDFYMGRNVACAEAAAVLVRA